MSLKVSRRHALIASAATVAAGALGGNLAVHGGAIAQEMGSVADMQPAARRDPAGDPVFHARQPGR